MIRVAVLTGGSTPERHVAFAGAAQVVRSLREAGCSVTVVDTVTGPVSQADEARILKPAVGRAPPTPDEIQSLTEREHLADIVALPELCAADLVFLVLHGRQGEGGEIQALLERAGIAYTGSGPTASSLAMDKDAAKRRFVAVGVPTPPWCMWPAEPQALEKVGFPLVVKPSKVGSSVGISVVRHTDELAAAVRLAETYDDQVLIEKYLDGREFTVGVLGDRALAVGEIVPRHLFFDYECKYTPGMTEETFPAEIPAALTRQIQEWARRAHAALGLRDFSRIDFKADETGVPQCLEANTLPGLTATSLLPQSAAAAGMPFRDLCLGLCEAVLARTRSRNKC